MPQLDVVTYIGQVTTVVVMVLILYIVLTWRILPDSILLRKFRKKILPNVKIDSKKSITSSSYTKTIARIVRVY